MSRPWVSFVLARTRFPLGRVVVTEKACRLDPAVIADGLHRHARGDFGPIHYFHADNAHALRQGGGITSTSLDPHSDRFFLMFSIKPSLSPVPKKA